MLWYTKLEYESNARVVRASKLTEGIDIIKDSQQNNEEQLFFDYKKDEERENWELLTDTMLLKISSTSINNFDNFEKIYNK